MVEQLHGAARHEKTNRLLFPRRILASSWLVPLLLTSGAFGIYVSDRTTSVLGDTVPNFWGGVKLALGKPLYLTPETDPTFFHWRLDAGRKNSADLEFANW